MATGAVPVRRVEGAWQTEEYIVGGTPKPVDGVLLLTEGRWATLYFVPGVQGPWGSAEAGSYEFDGTTLTFHHRLIFQGGGGRDVTIEQSADRTEACRVELEETTLAIHFPSGNTLRLRRAE